MTLTVTHRANIIDDLKFNLRVVHFVFVSSNKFCIWKNISFSYKYEQV